MSNEGYAPAAAFVLVEAGVGFVSFPLHAYIPRQVLGNTMSFRPLSCQSSLAVAIRLKIKLIQGLLLINERSDHISAITLRNPV